MRRKLFIKKIATSVLSMLLVICLAMSITTGLSNSTKNGYSLSSNITAIDNGNISNDLSQYFNSEVVTALPDSVSDDQEISLIISMSTEDVVDAYVDSGMSGDVSQFVLGSTAKSIKKQANTERKKLVKALNKSGVNYTYGETYDNVLSGFEITIKAVDFEKVAELMSTYSATTIVGEVYEQSDYKVVENKVDVDENTGIFENKTDYSGKGVVVAILDTGLDYTHTAFKSNYSTESYDRITLSYLRNKLSSLDASTTYSGLSVEDLYISRKVPYAYDYADKDPDVLPINSSHGTHVAGIIAGDDDTITGVAVDVQLAIMKVFSDASDGAKTSWLLAALEDCVTLGVDVINMSLGSACGFSREVDKENVQKIYDSVKAAGISLITAASNSYNSTFGSDKNGNNALTTNPDSGTVGSPATYDASLAVASVDGVKTPYITYNGEVMYFKEASTSDNTDKDFVNEVLTALGNYNEYNFTYVTISGYGEHTDYTEDNEYYKNKIALVKRGSTTFEDKVSVAQSHGCIGIIIYNNVSGDISMSVGNSNTMPVCSLSREEGEKLAANSEGQIKISKDQVAGPFMSDFSSWGPTSDLKIKPEITGHGGEIYSAVPGQGYEKLSGTSMAAPNVAGATALIRQYVKEKIVQGGDAKEVTAVVNQLMMSTADILLNKTGLAYSVRKQGAGLVSMSKATTAESYLITYDSDGNVMDKTKLELGDDKNKTGVYEMTFGITNVSGSTASYDLSAIVNTEGVNSNYTSHSEQTITQEGYALTGAENSLTVISVSNGSNNGLKVAVDAGKVAKVTVRITLSDEDKAYLEQTYQNASGETKSTFANGMYVEGFIKLTGVDGTAVSLNVPFLAFYGDWTQAPIFDEEYYDTNKDELNAGLDAEDKIMADAYATRAIGTLYSDYITTLGAYYFIQNPSNTQIAASKDHIAISNQTSSDGSIYTVSGIRSINAGLLRNVKKAYMTVTDDTTGELVWSKEINNQRKSYSSGSTIYSSSMEVDFSTLDQNLKNNTKYTFKVVTYIDYSTEEWQDEHNLRNTFEFQFYVDFEAPLITDVSYRTEYDSVSKKTKLYADISIYDNHYAMAMQLGQIVKADASSGYTFTMKTFGSYLTPIYSSYNSTSMVSVELTDYVQDIKNSAGIVYNADGNYVTYDSGYNAYIVNVYDYAMNAATYEIKLPNEVVAMYFSADGTNVADEISMSPNETKAIADILNVYPSSTWVQTLDYVSSDEDVMAVVNNYIVAKKSGSATLTATGKTEDGLTVTATVTIKVLAEGDEGYTRYTLAQVNKFSVTGYETKKAYYSVSSDDRDIGVTGGDYSFGSSYALSMYPSESVQLIYTLESYYPSRTNVVFTSSNANVVTIDENGIITAVASGERKRSASVTARVTYADENGNTSSTNYSTTISITVKEAFKTQSIYLMSYKGLGGRVEIPSDKGLTTIYAFAFSNYNYVNKDTNNGDVIDEEDPYYIKQWYIGEDTITSVIIPEGVTTIEEYAFAGLTALESVTFPSTLKTIGVGAFYGCTNLKELNGLEYVQFINKDAFRGATSLETVKLDRVVAIGDYAFYGAAISNLVLPSTAQSIGAGAFYGNKQLTYITFNASSMKVASYAFSGCTALQAVDINAAVISSYVFNGCTAMSSISLGKDVQVINEFAFTGTNISKFDFPNGNSYFETEDNGANLVKKEDGVKTLIMVAPAKVGTTVTTDATVIAKSAFANNAKIYSFTGNNVTTVEAYAFMNCTNLMNVALPMVDTIGDYAFAGTKITTISLDGVSIIGAYAFASTQLIEIDIPKDVTVGNGAFYRCNSLEAVSIGKNVAIGSYAFANIVNTNYTYESSATASNISTYYETYQYEITNSSGNTTTYTYYRYKLSPTIAPSKISSLTIGDGSTLGAYAFSGSVSLENVTLGDGVYIGNYCFYNAKNLTSITGLDKAISVGNYAFSGVRLREYAIINGNLSYAYDPNSANGYKYTSFAPALTNADLSSVTMLGDGVFAGNSSLETVTLNEELKRLPDGIFMYCSSLTTVSCSQELTHIGSYAFCGSGIIDTTNLKLEKVTEIGSYAFALTKLTSVTLNTEGTIIDDYAFYACTSLIDVENLGKVTYIGVSAFMGAGLTSLDLSSAAYIGDFAFASSKVTSVNFGDKKETLTLGENPFYNCNMSTFAREEKQAFGNITITTTNVDYEVANNVSVIGGVLYKTVANGKVLVSYPIAMAGDVYTVEDNTVRISARAFANSSLKSVTLPLSLVAIGDKAFYGCEKLGTVVFQSLEAPLLEETYDTSYLSYNNMPFTGYLSNYKGLGISKYYMWNVSSRYTNYYFGANFVNYVGKVDNKLVMVRPDNGTNYDSFIYTQYFDTVVNGKTAPTSATLSVLSMINALNKTITLSDKDAVKAARTAYDNLSTEQKALVTNYSYLTNAESTIAYLENRDNPVTPDNPDDNGGSKANAGLIVAISLGAIVLLVGVAAVVLIIKNKNKNRKVE